MNDTEEGRDDPVESGVLDGKSESEPRGGLQSEEYRSAGPSDVVEDEGAAMSGPAGAPQEDRSVEERRRLTDELRAARERDDPEPRNPAR